MRHQDAQDMIPFYVAGTLPQAEARALEQHLADCAMCRRALEEWRVIGGAVRAEAEDWAQRLPPLGPEVRRRLNRGSQATLPLHPVAAQRVPTRAQRAAFGVPATLVAAMVMILVGAIWIIALSRGEGTLQVASDFTGTPTPTLTPQIAPTESATPIPQPTTSATDAPQPTNTLFIPTLPPIQPSETPIILFTRVPPLPVQPSETPPPLPPTPFSSPDPTLAPPLLPFSTPPLPLPTSTPGIQMLAPTEAPLPAAGRCTVVNHTGQRVDALAGPYPGMQAVFGLFPNEQRAAILRSDNGWYLLETQNPDGSLSQGWVTGLPTTGPCDQLPVIPASLYAPTPLPPSTASESGLFPTPGPLP